MFDEFPVIFRNKKYDIKRFLSDHPGGVNTLMKYEGKSVDGAMCAFYHSSNAYHMLEDFRVHCDSDVMKKQLSDNGRVITKEECSRNEEEIEFLDELEARLDWSRPLLTQLDAIAPHYHLWVNSAVYRTCRLFSSPVLESLTYTPWYLVPIVWVPIILFIGISQFLEKVAFSETYSKDSLTLPQFCWHLIVGLFLWSSLEYSLHRWVFHLNPGSSLTMIRIHFLIHGLHHKTPFDGLRQVFPPVPALFLTCIIYAPFRLFLSHSLIKLTGGLTGYLVYDMIHYYVHHGSPREGSYLYAMKRYHSNHHFVNHDKGFGISSNLWDHVFQTYVRVKKLGFSLHW